jgi:phospholipase A1
MRSPFACVRSFAACILFNLAIPAQADITLTTDTPQIAAGDSLALALIVTNDAAEPLTIDIAAPLHLRFETRAHVSILEFAPEISGPVEVAPNGFVKIPLTGQLPDGAQGTATLTATGLEANPLMIQVAPADNARRLARTGNQETDDSTSVPALIDKPPPLAVSMYEPVYMLIGGDGGLNAKFQISFRYRLFDGEGRLASRLSWIDDLYLGYSQTSLWDLNELSKPFRDSSYRPRLFYADYDLGRLFDGRVRLGVETGVGHESNGKDGDASRSYNMFYVRPTFTYGDPEGFNIYVAPLLHNYVAKDENEDIADYRGYVDWLIGAGSKGGLNFWTVLRKGKRSDYGSIEANLSYPLSKLSGGDLTGWLMLQYFGGYGESLLDYNRKLDAQFRLGIAVAL